MRRAVKYLALLGGHAAVVAAVYLAWQAVGAIGGEAAEGGTDAPRATTSEPLQEASEVKEKRREER